MPLAPSTSNSAHYSGLVSYSIISSDDDEEKNKKSSLIYDDIHKQVNQSSPDVPGAYKCSVCDKRFKSLSFMCTHTSERKCGNCGKVLQCGTAMSYHLQSNCKELPIFKISTERGAKNTDVTDKLSCDLCSHCAASHKELKRHIKKQHSTKPTIKTLDSSVSPGMKRPADAPQHNPPTNLKPALSCEVCDLTTSTVDGMLEHVATHLPPTFCLRESP